MVFKAYNTDWVGVKNFSAIRYSSFKNSYVGNGGFSNAAQYAFQQMKISYEIVNRNNWHELENISNLIFNATPVQISKRTLLMQDHQRIMVKIAMLQAENNLNYILNGHGVFYRSNV